VGGEAPVRHVTVRGERVPALGLGTGQLADDVCYRAVRHALDLGYRHVDTARAYGNEHAVGKALRDSGIDRDEVFLTTKVWRDDLAGDRVRASVAASLADLGVDRVDLVLVHWPADDVPLVETMTALRELRDEGWTRHVGLSNFTPPQVREAARHAEVFCNQVEYHPLLAQDELLDQSRRLGHLLTAYSPIAQGEVAREPVVRRIAERHGRTPAQIALRWLVEQPGVAAIPRSHRPEHIEANLRIFDFSLAEEEKQELHRVARERAVRLSDPEYAPRW
jgi:2,5-diketo-D-gluconate reductase B